MVGVGFVAFLMFEFLAGRLVLDSLEELMVLEGGERVLDGHRVMSEGDLVNTTARESHCEGVMEELEVWEVITVEGGKNIRNHFEITKLIDVEQDTIQISNIREPWVTGHVLIR